MNIIEYGSNWIIQDKLDDKLINEIKDFFGSHIDFLYKDKEGYSTTGNNSEQYWLKREYGKTPFNYKNQECEEIKQKFKEQVYGRLEAASLLKDDVCIEENASWTVIGEEGSYHTVHTHGKMSGHAVSCVLYLNVPEVSESEDAFHLNNIFLILHTNQLSSPFVRNSCESVQHVKPKVGTLLIFPTNVPHGTYPQTKGIRQTFNVDYQFLHKNKTKNISYN